MYYYSPVLPGSFCTPLEYPFEPLGFLLAPHSQDLFRSFTVTSFFPLRLSALDFHLFPLVPVWGDLYHNPSGRSAVCFSLLKSDTPTTPPLTRPGGHFLRHEGSSENATKTKSGRGRLAGRRVSLKG